ncbi:MAG: tRNA lysidine(34) synthetase TilS [Saccharofermentans sp.]|nr:tRNA lysidine(34) synthetase TilS [Saccharofermentans sp.]
MTIFDKVAEYGDKHGLFDCDVIVAGLSGGPDSLALVEILTELKAQGRISSDIRCVHINHNLRPGDCMNDQRLAEDYCKAKSLPLKVYSFDVAAIASSRKISSETCGRRLRYEAFEEYSKEFTGSVRIATAHHMDDLAETMLMNLFRGSGLKGLITPRPIAGNLIRPLLCLRKSELVSFVEERGIAYAVDSTNELSCCTRNVWRNEIIPQIAKSRGLSDDPVRQLYKTNLLLEEDSDYIEENARKAYELCVNDKVLDAKAAGSYHKSIRTRLLRMLWLDTFDNLTDLELVNIEDCDKALLSGEQVELDMPFARKFIKFGSQVMFDPGDSSSYLKLASKMGYAVSREPVKLEVTGDQVWDIAGFTIKAKVCEIENDEELEYNNYSWFYPLNNKEVKITLTNALASEDDLKLSFARAGSEGSKELRRLFTDLKIPKSARRNILYVRAGGRIVYIPGFGHSEGFTSALSRDRYNKADHCNRFLRLDIERRTDNGR